MCGILARMPDDRPVGETAIDLVTSRGQGIPEVSFVPGQKLVLEVPVSAQGGDLIRTFRQLAEGAGQPEVEHLLPRDDARARTAAGFGPGPRPLSRRDEPRQPDHRRDEGPDEQDIASARDQSPREAHPRRNGRFRPALVVSRSHRFADLSRAIHGFALPASDHAIGMFRTSFVPDTSLTARGHRHGTRKPDMA